MSLRYGAYSLVPFDCTGWNIETGDWFRGPGETVYCDEGKSFVLWHCSRDRVWGEAPVASLPQVPQSRYWYLLSCPSTCRIGSAPNHLAFCDARVGQN
eukprot:scaffold7729_cov172-Amphora_coffeaeformis.AAC.10